MAVDASYLTEKVLFLCFEHLDAKDWQAFKFAIVLILNGKKNEGEPILNKLLMKAFSKGKL